MRTRSAVKSLRRNGLRMSGMKSRQKGAGPKPLCHNGFQTFYTLQKSLWM